MGQHTMCRICSKLLPEPFLDLGSMPLANAFLASPDEFIHERSYPLAVTNCPACGLVQLTYAVSPQELYRNYLYVSSTSETVRVYAESLAGGVVKDLQLGPSDLVVEIGSNDGTVLRAFQQRGVRVLGIEPAENIASLAVQEGVPTVNEFFSSGCAGSVLEENGQAQVILARHVFAHIDDWHDLMRGILSLLAPDGCLLIEVPYLGDLLERLEFDTIYHEHLSYVALGPVKRLCDQYQLRLVDVERVPLHGGSILLRIQRAGETIRETDRLRQMLEKEEASLWADRSFLERFAKNVFIWKVTFESFLDKLEEEGGRLVGYGAAAKANTLLNFVPRAARAMKFILDKSPHKQGRYTPGTHLPVVPVERWQEEKATHILILAWNFQEEIRQQLNPFSQRGGRFVIPIPKPEVV